MNILSIAAVGIISALLSLTIKRHNPEIALLISIGAGAVMLVLLIGNIVPMVQAIGRMVDEIGVSGDYFKILLKCLGICILTQFACDACKDAGQSLLCSQVELGGKAAVMITAMPLMLKLIEVAVGIMEK